VEKDCRRHIDVWAEALNPDRVGWIADKFD
jgi:hypothetical protein